ncbi:unnamed protein product, partial [Sphacelaria rigidula]
MVSPVIVGTPVQALEKTQKVIEENRPWYQAVLLRAETAEAAAGETATGVVIEGLALMVNAVNIDAVKPACAVLSALFEAVKGATAAREELLDLLSYCVLITSIVLDNARAPELPAHIQTAVQQVTKEITNIHQTAIQFDAKRGRSFPRRRLPLHARDRTRIKTHRAALETILTMATSAAALSIAADASAIRTKLTHSSAPRRMARVPPEARSRPPSFVERTALVSEIVSKLTAADASSAPYALFGMGGAGKTMLASAVVRNPDVLKHFQGGVYWLSVGRAGETQLLALLEGLAAKVKVSPTGPLYFDSEDEVIRSLTATMSEDGLPRLVVVDDVWQRDIVNLLMLTGLQLLVTTRVRSVVAMQGGCTEVGSMDHVEARQLLKSKSGAVALPEREADQVQVAEECGRLALALAIAGSLPCVTGSPDSAVSWHQLHLEIKAKKATRLGLQMSRDIADDKSKRSLYPVLSVSLEELGQEQQDMFLSLVVLARGVWASTAMLATLWEKDDKGAQNEADFLAQNTLLHEAEGSFYVHDLLLDFIKLECKGKERHELVEGAVGRQTRYLSRLSVVRKFKENEGLSTDVYALIRLWRSLEELSGNEQLGVERYRASLLELGRAETTDVADAYALIGGLFRLQGKFSEAECLYERCQAIREIVFDSEHLDVATALHNRAVLLQLQGKFAEAERLYERCQAMKEKLLDPEDPVLATLLLNRAGLLKDQGKFTEAEVLYEQCQAMQEKVLGLEHPDLATTLNNRGGFAEAEGLYERCQSIMETVLRPEHPDLAVLVNNRAGLLQLQGKFAEAERLYEGCQAITEKVHGPEHPDLAVLLHNRARLLKDQGKFAEAERLYEKCQAMQEKVLGPEHPRLATTLHNRAGLLQHQVKGGVTLSWPCVLTCDRYCNKFAEAERLYEQCQAIREKVLGPEHFDLAATLNNRAGLLKRQGKLAEAEPLYERCETMLEKILGPQHPDLAGLLHNRAGLLQLQGKLAQAERLYERCQAIREIVLGPEHFDLAATLHNRALLLQHQGKFSEAEPLYESCQAITEKVLGPEDPRLTTLLHNRANGKLTEAERLYERCQAISENVLGPLQMWWFCVVYYNTFQGKLAAAERLYERCQAIQEEVLGPEDPRLATLLHNRASLLQLQGKLAEAERLYERCQAMREKILGPEHPDLAATLNDRAGLLKQQGKLAEAERLYERCEARQETVLGPKHPDMATLLPNRAGSLQDQ